MEMRKKVARYSLISTVMQGISLACTVGMMIMLVVLTFVLGGWIGESAGLLKDVNSDDVTAGWQVLFGAAGSFFGVLAWSMLIVAALLLIGPMIAELVAMIYGICTYKKRDTVDFKRMVRNDSIIKLVINSAMVIIGILSLPSSDNVKSFMGQLDDFAKIILICTPSIVCVVVSILALRNINDMEELPEESGQYYMANTTGE